MKYYLTILATCLSVMGSYGQLKINQKKRLLPNEHAITTFITDNKFEYALILWSTSIWSRAEDDFYCLLKQDGEWHTALLSSPVIAAPNPLYILSIQQSKLTAKQADSLLAIIKPDSAFNITQNQLNKLPKTCSYIEDGKKTTMFGIDDAATHHLIQFSNKKTSSLRFYAAGHYLESCYPNTPEYGILKGFVNTVNQISNIFKQE